MFNRLSSLGQAPRLPGNNDDILGRAMALRMGGQQQPTFGGGEQSPFGGPVANIDRRFGMGDLGDGTMSLNGAPRLPAMKEGTEAFQGIPQARPTPQIDGMDAPRNPVGVLNADGGGMPRNTGLFGSHSRLAAEAANDGAGAGKLFNVRPDPNAVKPEEKLSWLDGGKFGLKDGLALAMASIGDSLMTRSGGQSWALQNMMKQRQGGVERAMEAAKKAKISAAMKRQGFNSDQAEIALLNPESLGSNYNQRFGTRSVADGTNVVTGGPGGQESTFYQRDVPDWEKYPDSLGLKPGSEEYYKAAEDFVLRSDGPTAFGRDKELDDYRTGNDVELEGVRQGNRTSLEGLRQRNRLGLKGTPSARAVGAPKVASPPTATGPNGQKLKWNGSAWVPAR